MQGISSVSKGGLHFIIYRHPFIFLDGNEPTAAVLAGPQVAFFFFAANPADNIEIYLEAISFTTVRAEFCRHA